MVALAWKPSTKESKAKRLLIQVSLGCIIYEILSPKGKLNDLCILYYLGINYFTQGSLYSRSPHFEVK